VVLNFPGKGLLDISLAKHTKRVVTTKKYGGGSMTNLVISWCSTIFNEVNLDWAWQAGQRNEIIILLFHTSSYFTIIIKKV